MHNQLCAEGELGSDSDDDDDDDDGDDDGDDDDDDDDSRENYVILARSNLYLPLSIFIFNHPPTNQSTYRLQTNINVLKYTFKINPKNTFENFGPCHLQS